MEGKHGIMILIDRNLWEKSQDLINQKTFRSMDDLVNTALSMLFYLPEEEQLEYMHDIGILGDDFITSRKNGQLKADIRK